MTPKDQKMLIRELVENVVTRFNEAHKAGEVPTDWNGYEIRQWLADKFTDQTGRIDKRGNRMKNYRNTVQISVNL